MGELHSQVVTLPLRKPLRLILKDSHRITYESYITIFNIILNYKNEDSWISHTRNTVSDLVGEWDADNRLDQKQQQVL